MHSDRTKHMSTSRSRAGGAAATFLLAVAAAACGPSTAEGAKTPADRAAFMERTRCAADDDDKALALVLGGNAVQGVKPLYSNFESAKSGYQSELRGATVTLSALSGVTAEWLDRALECHSAKNTLGHSPGAADDPFWLPGSSVDIDVRSAKDGFDVAVTGFSPDDARQILARANAFAKSKMAASPDAGAVSH